MHGRGGATNAHARGVASVAKRGLSASWSVTVPTHRAETPPLSHFSQGEKFYEFLRRPDSARRS